AGEQGGADRHVGDWVQELPHDGQDDAGVERRAAGAERLREDQVPGGGSGRRARQERAAAPLVTGFAGVRHPEAEGCRRVLNAKAAVFALCALCVPHISPARSTGRMRSHSGHVATRPLRGSVDVNATCERVRPTMWSDWMRSSEYGQRTDTSSV